MKKEFSYWDKEAETMSRETIKAFQLVALKKQITNALKTTFYKDRLAKAGITSPDDIRTLDDLRKIPFTTKHDLREVYPYGLLLCRLIRLSAFMHPAVQQELRLLFILLQKT